MKLILSGWPSWLKSEENKKKKKRNALKVDLMENWEFEFHSNFSKLKSVSWQIDDNITDDNTRKFVEIREELLIGVTDSW